MKKKITSLKNAVMTIGGVALFRLIPHIPNATPLGYMLVLSARRKGLIYAMLVLGLSLFISDLILGFYGWQVMLGVYLSFVGYIVVARYLITNESISSRSYALASGAFLFFLGSNTAVWLFSPMYVNDITGLTASLVAGLPFLGTMLVGDFASLSIHEALKAAVRYKKAKHMQPVSDPPTYTSPQAGHHLS